MTNPGLLDTPLLARSGRRTVAPPSGLRLFDDTNLQLRVVAHVIAAPAVRLADVGPPPGPGAYTLSYHGPHPGYRDLDRPHVIYAGKTAHLPERISSHISSLNDTLDLDVADFTAVLISTASLMHAEVAEHLLTGAFQPRWNQPGWRGFGSRPQGAGRGTQKPTDWDRRHPGRSTRTQARELD